MRSMNLMALACAMSAAGVVACSDDGGDPAGAGGTSQTMGNLQGQGGSAGSAGSSTTSGGTGGGQPAGNQGGSDSGMGGTMSAMGGSAGSGMAGSMSMGGSETEPDAGAPSVGEPDAGGDPGEEDPGDEDPGDEDPGLDAVGFSDVFPILLERCGPCHNPSNGLPAFGQADEDAAFELAVEYAAAIAGRVDGSGGNIMPPNCINQGNCLSVEQVETIQSWAENGTPR